MLLPSTHTHTRHSHSPPPLILARNSHSPVFVMAPKASSWTVSLLVLCDAVALAMVQALVQDRMVGFFNNGDQVSKRHQTALRE